MVINSVFGQIICPIPMETNDEVNNEEEDDEVTNILTSDDVAQISVTSLSHPGGDSLK